MGLSAHNIAAVIPGILTLDVIDFTATVDEGWSPYAQVSLTCWTPDDEALLDAIDPLEVAGLRATVTLERTLTLPSSRTFNLALVSREVDYDTGTMVLKLESDESLLQDWTLLNTATERTYGLSIKTAVSYALAKIGAALEPGAADASLDADPATEPVLTNLIVNPTTDTNEANWTAGGGCTVGRISGVPGTVPGFTARMSCTVAGTMACFANQTTTYMPATAGKSYTFSIRLRGDVARPSFIGIRWLTSGNVQVGTDVVSPTITYSNTAFTTYTVTGTAPATTARIGAIIWTTSAAVGNRTFMYEPLLVEDAPPGLEYFDGSTAATGLYAYAWTGTAHASPSTRTPLPQSAATIWEPGVSAWDYVAPLVQAGGLKVYCDEARKWRLIEGNLAVDGVVTVATGVNVKKGRDLISRAGSESGWYLGVCIIYRWTDAEGERRVAYDIAGDPKKVKVITFDRAYPGPGAAASVLARAEGKGRVYDLSAISSYAAQPGMQLVATLPGVLPQVGVVSAVTWDSSDTMSVKSRGLIETPLTSWLFDPPGVSWAAVPVGIDWSEDI